MRNGLTFAELETLAASGMRWRNAVYWLNIFVAVDGDETSLSAIAREYNYTTPRVWKVQRALIRLGWLEAAGATDPTKTRFTVTRRGWQVVRASTKKDPL